MNVIFKELPNDNFTYMGLTADIVKSVIINDVPVGIVYLSKTTDERIYIEWIELLSVFRSKHLLRPIMYMLSKEYGTLYFESQEDLVKKYKAIHAENYDYDEDREMYLWKYSIT